MKNWNINPSTGDYVLVDGAPDEVGTLKIPAYIRLKVRRNQWLYAPNADYGSDFYLLRKRQTTLDASTIESIAERALQPIVDDGRADQITIQTTNTTRTGIEMNTRIVDATGEPEEIIFSQLGV